jgi:hypothetical protein
VASFVNYTVDNMTLRLPQQQIHSFPELAKEGYWYYIGTDRTFGRMILPITRRGMWLARVFFGIDILLAVGPFVLGIIIHWSTSMIIKHENIDIFILFPFLIFEYAVKTHKSNFVRRKSSR